MKKVPSVYTHSMKTIYLSLSAQVAEGTIFGKPPLSEKERGYNSFCFAFTWSQK